MHNPLTTRIRSSTFLAVVGLLVCLVGSASAQDPPHTPLGTPTAPPGTPGFVVPLVDEEPLPPSPREIIAETTLSLYDLVLAHEGDCPSLAAELDTFMDTKGDAIAEASRAIAEQAPMMTPEEITALGTFFTEHITNDPRSAAGQAALYPCLRSFAGQSRHYRVDRKMQRFFGLHEAMLDAIVGNVD